MKKKIYFSIANARLFGKFTSKVLTLLCVLVAFIDLYAVGDSQRATFWMTCAILNRIIASEI